MEHDVFMTFCVRKIREGERRLAHAARILIGRAAPELARALSDVDDEQLLHPLLFAYFSRPTPDGALLPLLFSLLPIEARPEVMALRTDETGRFYLPGVGYFHTAPGFVRLRWERATDRYRIEDQRGAALAHRFEPPLTLRGFELLRYSQPLLAPLCFDAAGRPSPVEIETTARRHAEQLDSALALLAAHDAALYGELSRAVRLLVAFQSDRVNSFAALGAHGATFFSADAASTEVFFLDDLVHQGCHVLFNAMTARRADFLRADPDRRVDTLTGRGPDARTVYGALHGIFGEYHMCRVLARVEQAAAPRSRARHELLGRLAFIARKYVQDTHNLDHDIYTDEGRYCFETLKQAGRQLLLERPELFSLDLGEQGYVFDYARFAARTPR